MKRKHILIKNEINNIIKLVERTNIFSHFYNENLIKRLKELKKEWYKTE